VTVCHQLVAQCLAGRFDSGLGFGLDLTHRVRGCEGLGRREELEGEQYGGEEREHAPGRLTSEHAPPSGQLEPLERIND